MICKESLKELAARYRAEHSDNLTELLANDVNPKLEWERLVPKHTEETTPCVADDSTAVRPLSQPATNPSTTITKENVA